MDAALGHRYQRQFRKFMQLHRPSGQIKIFLPANSNILKLFHEFHIQSGVFPALPIDDRGAEHGKIDSAPGKTRDLVYG